jgi:putative transposase
MITLTHCYRIYPDVNQEGTMQDFLEQSRRVYNYALRERKDWMQSRKCRVDACSIESEYIIPAETPYPNYYAQKKALTAARKIIPQLEAVHSQVLQEVLLRLDKAFRFMQERGFGFPRFKKYGQIRSLVFPQFKDNPITGNQIKIPKVGAVIINLHRPVPDGFVVKQVKVVKKASGWYAIVVLQADVNVPDPVAEGRAIGIDLGLEKFVATSTGELIARPRFFVELQSKLRWLQRKLRNKRKGSKNMRKAQLKVARLHERIHDTRKDFHYKVAHHLCDGVGMVFAEDLNLKAISRGMLCKHTLDAGFGGFLEILSHVSWKRGIYFAKVDANLTSQMCPNCGTHTGKKELKQRVHECDHCGFTTNRDVAAAMIVEQRGLATLGHRVKLPVDVSCSGDGLILGRTDEAGKPSRKGRKPTLSR